VGLHTAVPFAEELFVSGGSWSPNSDHRVWFASSLNAPGLRIVTRKPAARSTNPFIAPLSSRFDELDAQVWLEDVLVPWEKVFAIRFEPTTSPVDVRRREGLASWLLWHQQVGWLARAEFTLGLALAITHAMELKGIQGVVDNLVNLVIDCQTIRSCVTAAELDPEVTQAGYLLPRLLHLAPATIYTLRSRQRIAETLRNLAGQAGVLSPADVDFADEGLAAGLEESFGGGGYTATQRAALLQLAWDHVSSGLDGREAAFETHANGGIPAWRIRIQRWFDRYNELANGVLGAIAMEMPAIDLDSLRDVMPRPRPAQASPPPAPSAPTTS